MSGVRIDPELAQLWLHAMSEYQDIRDLEAKLAKARVRHQKLHDEIHAHIAARKGIPDAAACQSEVALHA